MKWARIIFTKSAVYLSISALSYFLFSPNAAYALSREVNVPADAYWVNSGLYLHKGQTVHISASGTWNTYPNSEKSPTGPEGDPSDHSAPPCNLGALGGRIGLIAKEFWENKSIICLGKEKNLTANRDGILYFSSIDVGREDNSGSVNVKISDVQQNMISPPISRKNLSNLSIDPLEANKIETIELIGEHIILTLPVNWIRELTTQNASTLLDRMDDFYRLQKDLAGTVPYNGQRIRIAFSNNLPEGVGGFAGNPIFSGHSSSKELLDVLNKHADDAAWLYVHELGHDFEGVSLNYIDDFGDIWTNIFSTYALEKLGYDAANRYKNEISQEKITEYFQTGKYNTLAQDPWLGLAMLMGIKEQYGWDAFKNFFRYIKLHPAPPGMTNQQRWTWIRDAFLKSSQMDRTTQWWPWIRNGFRNNSVIDLTDYFKRWHIPLDG